MPTTAPIAPGDVDTVAAEACDRLDELGFVDVLERGDAMWAAFQEWFGSDLAPSRKNETPLDEGQRIDLDDVADRRTMGLLQDRSAADLQVWHHVADRVVGDHPAARSMADASFGATLARIAVAQTRTVSGPDPSVSGAEDEVAPVAPVGSSPIRFARLVRRGPRARAARIQDEVASRVGDSDES